MDYDNKRIGQKIKRLRHNLGLSQEEVAEFVGIPRPSVSMIEKGKRSINISELLKLSFILKVNKDYLLDVSLTDKIKKKSICKKFYFTRHGEAMDDLYDMYGGWADPDLSARGVSRAYENAVRLKNEKILPEIVLTSPLKRAKTKAEILAREFGVEMKVLAFLKERNTYGLLCGVNKEMAKHDYPELVEKYEKGEYVLASERYEDFLGRLNLLWEHLKEVDYNKVLCVTHGKLLTTIIKEYLKMEPDHLEEDCLLVVGLDKKGFYYIQSEGITFLRKKEL